MRNLILSIILFAPFLSFGQTVQSTCNINDTIATKFKKDADRLAIRRVYHINSTYKDSVKVNKSISDVYLRALIAVYNATAIPQRDTVFKLCNIHTKADPDMNTFFVTADSTLAWMKNLRNNIFPTGNSTIDYSMNKYKLQVQSYQGGNIWVNHDVVFKTDSNLNSQPLGATIFNTVTGVAAAGPYATPFDGPDIYDSINPNFTRLTFAYKWDDCALGCIYLRSWTFRVMNDCSVWYTGVNGVALPVGVGIKENMIEFENLKVYPIPSKNTLFVDFGQSTIPDRISLMNVLGQCVFVTEEVQRKHEIDISSLQTGIYYLKIEGRSENKTMKFVKD